MHATFGFPLPLVIEGSLFFPIGKTLLYIYIYGLDPFDHTVLKWIQTPHTHTHTHTYIYSNVLPTGKNREPSITKGNGRPKVACILRNLEWRLICDLQNFFFYLNLNRTPLLMITLTTCFSPVRTRVVLINKWQKKKNGSKVFIFLFLCNEPFYFF